MAVSAQELIDAFLSAEERNVLIALCENAVDQILMETFDPVARENRIDISADFILERALQLLKGGKLGLKLSEDKVIITLSILEELVARYKDGWDDVSKSSNNPRVIQFFHTNEDHV